MSEQNSSSELNLNNSEFEVKNGRLVNYKGRGNDVIIPNGVKLVYCSFYDCKSPMKISVPQSVESVDLPLKAFKYLAYITVDEQNETYKSIDGNLYSHDGKVLIKYAVAKEDSDFSIPDGVKEIAEDAFYCGEELFDVKIPNSVTTIGKNAFEGCSWISSIEIPESVEYIGEGAFKFCQRLKKVVFKNPCDWVFVRDANGKKPKKISSTILMNPEKAAKLFVKADEKRIQITLAGKEITGGRHVDSLPMKRV